MRSRNIKPGFYKNESLAECSVWARYICPGLWMMADRLGRMEDRPKRIKAELLAYDTIEVEPLLQELTQHGHIVRYEVNGEPYIQILNFTKHQSPHSKEQDSVIPPLPTTKPEANIRSMTIKSEASLRHAPDNASLHDSFSETCLRQAPDQSGVTPPLQDPPAPPDSLIPDLLIPESPIGDVRACETNAPKKLPNLSRLPFDSLPPEWAQWVQADMGWNAETTADVWACFRDYWQGKTGKSAKKSDWGATWRVWCRKETVRNSGGNYANAGGYSQNHYRPNKSERARAAIIKSAIDLGYVPDPRSSGKDGT